MGYGENEYLLTGLTQEFTRAQLDGRGSKGPSAEDMLDDNGLYAHLEAAEDGDDGGDRALLAQETASGYVPTEEELDLAMKAGYKPPTE